MRFGLALGIVIALAACKKDEKQPASEGSASGTASGSASGSGTGTGTASGSGSAAASGSAKPDYVARVKDFAAKMCACKDVACLETTEAEGKALDAPVTELSNEQADELEKLDAEISTCALKIAEAEPLPAEHAAEGNKLVASLREAVDAACTCTDMPCFEDKTKGVEQLLKDAEALFPRDDEGHLQPAFEALMKRAQICVEKLLPDDPNAE